MKILFIINELGNGGRERRLVQLIRTLDKNKEIEMMIALTQKKIEYDDINDTSAIIRIMQNGHLLKRYRELKAVFEKFQPDIVHLWIETALFCVAVPLLTWKYNCKYIAGFVADGNSLDRLPRYQRIAIKFTFRCADVIVSNSKAGLKAKEVPLNKSYVIYNGFDPSRLAKIDINRKRAEMGISCKYLVTMCGRMEPAKDWDSFILLAETVGKMRDDVFFLGVAGRGRLVDHYLTIIKEKGLNNISFVTCRSDVMEIFAASDVSVLFTNSDVHAEGVSNSIMESMAAGVPVIATEGGGTAEIIISGEDGFIIDPKSVEMARDRLQFLLRNDSARAAMGEKAQQTVKDRFNLSSMGEQYFEIYKGLLLK